MPSLEDRFIFLAREIRLAEAAFKSSQSKVSSDDTAESGLVDDADLASQRRYIEQLRGEFSALIQNNRSTLSDRQDLEAAALETPIDASDFESDAPGRSGALAVMIGHSPSGDMGADGVAPPFDTTPSNARSEYYWNRDLAELIKAIGIDRGYEVEVFHRRKSGKSHIPEAYDPVRDWNPEATLELHFNSYDANVVGTETLYRRGRSDSMKWAQALQDQMVALYGRKRSDKSDRKIKPRRPGERGGTSLSQIYPSALIEPFFGDAFSDAQIGVDKKQELAVAVVGGFIAISDYTPTSAAAPAAGGEMVELDSVLSVTEEFDALRKLYAATEIDFEILKDISFAQWAHESDFGRSELASKHRNFGGMKWLDAMAPLAKPVEYRPAHDPDGRDYCGFDSLEDFIAGYWHRLDLPSLQYSRRNGGWRNHATSADEFINFIGPIWAPRGGTNSNLNDHYETKVRKRYGQLKTAGLLSSSVAGA